MTPSQQAQLGAGEVIGGALAVIAGDIEAGTGLIITAPSGGSSLALAAAGVGHMAGGAVGVAKGLGNLAMASARATSAGSGSGAAGPPAPAKPSINAQKQAGHVQGTPQYVNRVKQGKPTSTFRDAQQGAALTQEAWEKGTPLGTDGTLRLYNFERPIGIGPEGGGFQTQVRVSMDASGQIHGTPWGPVFQGPVQP